MGILAARGFEDIFIGMLRQCNNIVTMKKIHAQMVHFSVSQSNFLVTRMLDICDQNGEIGYAGLLFQQVVEPNIFLYNAMFRAYTRTHMYPSTIHTYRQMLIHSLLVEEYIVPNRFTYPFVVRSCGGLLDIDLGKQIHVHTCKYGLVANNFVENSLLDMYVKCDGITEAHMMFDEMPVRDVIAWNSLIFGHLKLGQVRNARALFDEMPNKTIVSWTAMISGYTKNRRFTDALNIFRRMQIIGVQPDWISLVAILPACAQLGALEIGKWIHFYAKRNNLLKKTGLCNALIEMYAKCGSVEEAFRVFNEISQKDVISWSSMITGLAHHGKAHEAIGLFHKMKMAKIEPNEVTFIGLLCACGHAGMLNEGLKYFYSMQKDYNIEPGIEHYGCLVDLLGRTGQIEQALSIIKGMKMKPGSEIWGSLLSSCRSYRKLDTAIVAMEHLLELEPDDMGNLVLLGNIYADLGKWEGVSRMRKLIKSKSMKRTPGCSLIEVDMGVQEFVSGDDSKPDIYRILDILAVHQSIRNDQIDDIF